MKAAISGDGKLVIISEGSTESYALKQWFAATEGCKVKLMDCESDSGDEESGLVILNDAEQIAQDDLDDEQREGIEE